MPSPSDVIRSYIRAKDENRPHLMRQVFAETATLEMVVRTETIAFPPRSSGLDAITDVLIRRFAQTYENVYTFCLSEPPGREERRFSCEWLVGMSEKAGGALRVGRGRYDWSFQAGERCLADHLTITIETMPALPPDCLGPVMDWLCRLPYPWCPFGVAARDIPELAGLAPIAAQLAEPPV